MCATRRDSPDASNDQTAQDISIRFVVLGFIGYAYGILLIFPFKEDMISITNTAFTIIATLAALSPSFER